jgi:hypothetical protein
MKRHNVTLCVFTIAVSFGALSCKGEKNTAPAGGPAQAVSASAAVTAAPAGAASTQPIQASVGFDSSKVPSNCDKTASIDGGVPGKIGAGCPKTWSDALAQATAWCADPAKSAGKPRLGLYENCAQYTIVVQASGDVTDVCYYDAKKGNLVGSRLTSKNVATCRGDVANIPLLCPSRVECGQK